MTFEEIKLQHERIAAEFNSGRISIPRLIQLIDMISNIMDLNLRIIVDQHQKSITGPFEESEKLMLIIAEQTRIAALYGNMIGFEKGIKYVVEKSSVQVNYLI